MSNEEMIKALPKFGYLSPGKLGAGGQGTVYRVLTPSGKPQAVKVKYFNFDFSDVSREVVPLQRVDYHTNGRITYSDGVREGEAIFTPLQSFLLQRDISERTGLMGAQGTDHVLEYNGHSFFIQGNGSFGSIISTEFLEGNSLSHILENNDGLDLGIRNLIIHNIGVTLKNILDKGIVHGDLKPSNVFLGKDCSVNLLDFGSTRLLREYNFMEDTPEDVPVLLEERFNYPTNTPGFCSPEAANSNGLLYSRKSEYFAYALLAVAALSDGKSPFAKNDFELPISIDLRIAQYSDSSWKEFIEPKLKGCPKDLKKAIRMATHPTSEKRQIDPLIEVSGKYAYGHLSHSRPELISKISGIPVPRVYGPEEVAKFERKLGTVALSGALMGAAALYGPSVVDLVNNWF
jgi:serine/threonine protein kinase